MVNELIISYLIFFFQNTDGNLEENLLLSRHKQFKSKLEFLQSIPENHVVKEVI